MKKPILDSINQHISTLDWGAVLAFALPFSLYCLTACPVVASHDSAELTTAAATLGITRSTGYPTYLLLGHLWSHLPLGNMGLRMNLFSSFNAATTVLLAYLFLKNLNVKPWARLAGLGFLMVSPYFWRLALVAEVYTLQTMLSMVILLLAWRWLQKPTCINLLWLGLSIGIAFGNHLSTLLLLPGLAVVILLKQSKAFLHWKMLLAGLAGLSIGLMVYLYLPLRFSAQPVFNYATIYDYNGSAWWVDLHNPEGIWWLVSGGIFSSRMFAGVNGFGQDLAFFINQFWQAFFAIGIGPGILGLIHLFKKDRTLAWGTLIMFLLNIIFFTFYRVTDRETMFLPAYLIFALWMAFGFEKLAALLTASGEPANRSELLWQNVLKVVALALPVCFLAFTWQQRSQHHNINAQVFADEVFAQLEENALVFGKWRTIPVLQYYQLVEGKRKDVQLINRFLIDSANMEAWIIREMKENNRAVYLDEPTDELLDHVWIGDAEPLFLLKPKERGLTYDD